MIRAVQLADCPYVAWRNGGGRTRELLAWPAGAEWQVRVSVAEIEADGPFSRFDGVERAFAVLGGAGVVLALDGRDARLTPRDDALAFAGEAAPACRLIDGPTRDLNLMTRRRAGRPRLQRTPIAGTAWRGVFDGATLWWTDAPDDALPAPAHAWWLALEPPQ